MLLLYAQLEKGGDALPFGTVNDNSPVPIRELSA